VIHTFRVTIPTVRNGRNRYEGPMAATPLHLHSRGFRALIGTEQWNNLLATGNRRAFPTATRLLDQGAPSRIVHVIAKGRVRVVYTDASGNEVLVAVRGPGGLPTTRTASRTFRRSRR
jgi:hypothetical protein